MPSSDGTHICTHILFLKIILVTIFSRKLDLYSFFSMSETSEKIVCKSTFQDKISMWNIISLHNEGELAGV